jgi:hypothetical protein
MRALKLRIGSSNVQAIASKKEFKEVLVAGH